jgi:flagellar protein FliO/FliZ
MSVPVISAGSIAQSLMGLLAVLAVIAAAAWLVRRLAVAPGAPAGAIKVIAGAAVGQRERVVLVEVGGTWLVVGVAPGHVTALHAMPRAALEARQPHEPATERNFAGWMRHVLERRDGAG